MFDLIGAETDLGVNIEGSEQAPKLIIENINNKNIADKIYVKKPNIIKEKNKDNKAKNLNAIIEYNKKLYKEVDNVLKNKYFPITIGGDHTIAIASCLASLNNNEDIGIIWIDAHGDFNTFETTETGNIHGLPLASVCGFCQKLTDNLTDKYVKAKKCVIVGGRSIDKEEMNNIKNCDITLFTTNDIKEYGVKTIMEKAFKIAGDKVHISYDLDSIDPKIAPGVSIPEINGLNKKEAYDIMDYIVKEKDKIVSLDLVEYNPSFDKNEMTLNIAIDLLNKFINNKFKEDV